jgi:hypothetical protein
LPFHSKPSKNEIIMKPLLLSTLIVLTFAITPVWGVSEDPTAKPSAAKKHHMAKKHNVTKKHKRTSKPETAKIPPVIPVPRVVPVAATATPIAVAEPVVPVAPIAAAEAAAVHPIAEASQLAMSKDITAAEVSSPSAQPNMPVDASVIRSIVATPPAPPAVVLVPPPTSLPVNPYVQSSLIRPVVVNTQPANMPVAAPAMAPGVATFPSPPAVVFVPPLLSLPGNPYLQPILVQPIVANQPPTNFFPAFAIAPTGSVMPTIPAFVPSGIGSGVPTLSDIAMLTKSLVPTQLFAFLPGDTGASHMPISFSMVHPTGDKPLAVLTLKCPTEAAFGVAPPPVKLVHILLTTAMDGINYTGLLPFNLQQVCQ